VIQSHGYEEQIAVVASLLELELSSGEFPLSEDLERQSLSMNY
jgi:hypothetical protein